MTEMIKDLNTFGKAVILTLFTAATTHALDRILDTRVREWDIRQCVPAPYGIRLGEQGMGSSPDICK